MHRVSFEGVRRSVNKLTREPIMLWSALENILFGKGVNERQHNKKSSKTNHILSKLCTMCPLHGFPLHVELLGLVETLVGTEKVQVRRIVLLLQSTRFRLSMHETGCEAAPE